MLFQTKKGFFKINTYIMIGRRKGEIKWKNMKLTKAQML